MTRIRRATERDAAAWAAVVQAASPHLVLDAVSEAHEMRNEPADARRFVAEAAGTVVGVAKSRTYPGDDHPSLLVMVDPGHRRRGIGRALLDELMAPVVASGAGRATAIVEDDEGSRIASERWGFTVVRTLQKARVDPRSVPAPEPLPPGVEVVPLAEVGSERVWRVHQVVAGDDPSGLTLPVPRDVWKADWSDPRARPDLGRAVLAGGELAAYTMVGAAAGRAWSDMTGTLPQHRGRGFARLAKQHSLRALAEAGITQALTGNDAANRPMLAVNDSLGYVVVARPAIAERPLG